MLLRSEVGRLIPVRSVIQWIFNISDGHSHQCLSGVRLDSILIEPGFLDGPETASLTSSASLCLFGKSRTASPMRQDLLMAKNRKA